jgi:hypothetical protein|tara:strand:+ start:410 stop:628 length:219 start_codon:yes stop_codon:yes gene_type:complete
MNLGPRSLGIATSACRDSEYVEIRRLVTHIPITKDGMSPAVLGDDSAACALPLRTSSTAPIRAKSACLARLR